MKMNDLVRDQVLVAVEMLQGKLEAGESLEDRDLGDVKEIVTTAPGIMRKNTL